MNSNKKTKLSFAAAVLIVVAGGELVKGEVVDGEKVTVSIHETLDAADFQLVPVEKDRNLYIAYGGRDCGDQLT